MKKIFLSLCLICGAISFSFSQEFSYGLKGGVTYTMGGQITGYPSGENAGEPNHWSGTAQASGSFGFHGGAFLQVNFGNFFVRPEVVYSSLETEFDFPAAATQYHTPERSAMHSIETFTVPLMVGYNIFGPLDIYAGPVYSNILSSSLEGDQDDVSIVVQNTPINAQIGAKVEFGRFGFDLRYEHSLSSPEPQNLDIDREVYGVNRVRFDDSRINQVILSITFKIGGPGLNVRRSRPCY